MGKMTCECEYLYVLEITFIKARGIPRADLWQAEATHSLPVSKGVCGNRMFPREQVTPGMQIHAIS